MERKYVTGVERVVVMLWCVALTSRKIIAERSRRRALVNSSLFVEIRGRRIMNRRMVIERSAVVMDKLVESGDKITLVGTCNVAAGKDLPYSVKEQENP